MRQVTVKIEPNIFAKAKVDKFISNVQSMELVEMLKLDFQKGIKVMIIDLTFKNGYTNKDINWPPYLKDKTLLNQNKNTYTYLIKSQAPKMFLGLFKYFDFDLIWGRPSGYRNGLIQYTCMGSDEDINKFIKAIQFVGKISSISYKEGIYAPKEGLGKLTSKQKDIFMYAKQKGYYEYPRKINATQIAEQLNLSKATLAEHLRKIECKILSKIEF